MLGSAFGDLSELAGALIGHASAVGRTPVELFSEIFTVFLVLGTLVGIIVMAYTLQKAWKYRDGADNGGDDDAKGVVRPKLGEIPTGSGGGKKLFLSFGISAVIVLSLIVWTYSALLYVEGAPDDAEDQLVIEVTGQQFSWQYEYPNGNTETTLRVPTDRMVQLEVTSADVMHNYGIHELRVKTDAAPGQTTTAWFQANETGTYSAKCYELCGQGHSGMEGDVIVMEPSEYQEWYNSTEGSHDEGASDGGDDSHAIGGAA